jgi:hypothetical protein
MDRKNFRMEVNGPCDDALEDTIHEWYVPYYDSQTISDSMAVIEFRFISECCQEFMGDYEIFNDTLVYAYEQVNDEVCCCVCWYRYKLTISVSDRKFSEIRITGK